MVNFVSWPSDLVNEVDAQERKAWGKNRVREEKPSRMELKIILGSYLYCNDLQRGIFPAIQRMQKGKKKLVRTLARHFWCPILRVELIQRGEKNSQVHGEKDKV